jgi:hypothetical protein
MLLSPVNTLRTVNTLPTAQLITRLGVAAAL